ncbi:hypothetical protein [Xenorhabdus anantnagensis]|uniref:Uncharacterized protein n=1 Tax=Xenorhabdus anantnagensis TaxID=3025875 RepID=A0ABT5LUX3_9GAMM|nr:hypothetical protein [Xenorhabdus anantnagensis]MDC9598213.1 hypothetical protein [Xenorhabdus anantnagensis]
MKKYTFVDTDHPIRYSHITIGSSSGELRLSLCHWRLTFGWLNLAASRSSINGRISLTVAVSSANVALGILFPAKQKGESPPDHRTDTPKSHFHDVGFHDEMPDRYV